MNINVKLQKILIFMNNQNQFNYLKLLKCINMAQILQKRLKIKTFSKIQDINSLKYLLNKQFSFTYHIKIIKDKTGKMS